MAYIYGLINHYNDNHKKFDFNLLKKIQWIQNFLAITSQFKA